VPRVMSLRDVLLAFLAHRRDVLRRRTQHRLEKIAIRLEVLAGYLASTLNLDRVIKIIRNEDEPKPKLMKAFGLSELQAEGHPEHCVYALCENSKRPRSEPSMSILRASKRISESSWRRKSSRPRAMLEEIRAIDERSGLRPRSVGGGRGFLHRRRLPPKPTRSKRWSSANRSRSSVPRRVGCVPSKVTRNQNDMIKYREGDRERFWLHAETTDRLMLFRHRRAVLHARTARNCRADAETAKPSAASSTCRRNADIVSMFVHRDGASFCSLRRPGMVL